MKHGPWRNKGCEMCNGDQSYAEAVEPIMRRLLQGDFGKEHKEVLKSLSQKIILKEIGITLKARGFPIFLNTHTTKILTASSLYTACDELQGAAPVQATERWLHP